MNYTHFFLFLLIYTIVDITGWTIKVKTNPQFSDWKYNKIPLIWLFYW